MSRIKSKRKQQKQKPFSLITAPMQARLYEGVMLIFCAVAVFLLVSLLTYHGTDPGWTHIAIKHPVLNWGGKVGAWLADILLFLFGYVAYILPFLLFWGSLKAFTARISSTPTAQKTLVEMDAFLKGLGFICLILSSCGLVETYFFHRGLTLAAQAGGVVGYLISKGLIQLLNPMGSLLLLLTCFLSSLTLTMGISWLVLTKNLSRHGQVSLVHVYAFGYRYLRALMNRAKKPPVHVDREDKLEKEITPIFTKAVEAPKPRAVVAAAPPSVASVPEKPKEKSNQSQPDKKPQQLPSAVVLATGELPPLSLLNAPQPTNKKPFSQLRFEELSQLVEQRLLDFGVEVKVAAVYPGPVITRFELELAPGIKVSKITGLAKDIARSLSVASVRVVEVIPGKPVIGLEIANENREVVSLREILSSSQYAQITSPVSLALGKDIAGVPVVVDLAKMPHLLVAGTTGSGKSVSLNAMLLSMLYKALPSELRFILIDPKMLELSIYDGIPHLLTPVITDMKDATNALRWCVTEMDKRYRLMASLGVRNLAGYNLKIKEAIQQGNPILSPEWLKTKEGDLLPLEPLPLIVVVADELADMMMVVGKKVEELVVRLAQKARAAGIHLVLATQRPSVDVITGLIKANVPTRIAFQVSSRVDSRTILDQQGAEQLLGHGDMLYLPAGAGIPSRIHGAYVSDEEVHRVVAAWQTAGKPTYLEDVTEEVEEGNGGEGNEQAGESDPLYDQAVRIVVESRRASISLIQRRLRIGYNRAARLMESMEAAGLVTTIDSSGSREVLVEAPSA